MRDYVLHVWHVVLKSKILQIEILAIQVLQLLIKSCKDLAFCTGKLKVFWVCILVRDCGIFLVALWDFFFFQEIKRMYPLWRGIGQQLLELCHGYGIVNESIIAW